MAVNCLIGLPDCWLLFLPRPLRHWVLCAFIEDCKRLPVAGVQTARSDGKPGCNGETGDGEPGRDVARSEKLIIEQLVNGGAGSRVCLEHLLDEGGGHRIDVLGDTVVILFDPEVGLFEARSQKVVCPLTRYT